MTSQRPASGVGAVLGSAAVAALAGYAVMSLELVAVRLLAPWFGDSAYVWTNVIGVLLVALALGAWLGGTLAVPDRAAGRLRNVLLLAAALTAVTPWIAGSVAGLMVRSGLPLEAALPALVRGSLAATIVLFAPPVVLLGTVSPLLITARVAQARADAPAPIGPIVGRIAAASTAGSLVGTFATTHWLVPGVGSRATVLGCAVVLVLAAWLVRGVAWGGPARAASAGLLLVALIGGVIGGGPGPSVDGIVLAERESAYQFLQVVDRGEVTAQTEGAGRRVPGGPLVLRINEGLDSFHSVKLPGTPWTDGAYYDYYPPLLALTQTKSRTARVLSLGAAAGTFERVFHAAHGDRVAFDSVEIDPAVVELARGHFGAFAEPGMRVFSGLDARVFANNARADTYDVVLVDAYERQIYVPAHVASVEFFEQVRRILADGGIVCVNVGGVRFADPVVQAVARVVRAVFGDAWAFRVPSSRNMIVVARNGEAIERPERILADWAGRLPASADEVLRERTNAMGREGDWCGAWGGDAGALLRDDRPFLDSLQDTALRSYGEGTAKAVACAGNEDPAATAALLRSAYEKGHYEQVVPFARQASRGTQLLRFWIARSRWQQRDLRGAKAEYEAARVAEDATAEFTSQYIEPDLAVLAAELAGIDAAQGLRGHNGWMAVLAVAGLVFGTLGVGRVLRSA